MLTAFATRTVSGKTPPLPFRITLWLLTILFLGIAIAAVVAWWRLRQQLKELPEGQNRQGKSGRAGCLMVGAIPAVLFGLFLLDWAIQVS